MLLSPTDADLLTVVRSQFHTGPPEKLGVAVSGGSDSIAMLHILTRCFAPDTVELHAATVDHGLRPEAAQEAERVADLCERLGVTHSILRWRGGPGSGNLMDRARRARYALLADWARIWKLAEIAVGHTANDQAETVLMRLGRSAGVTGLSAMPVRRTIEGVSIVRPMLGISRSALQGYLREQKIRWEDDPSNENEDFDRIKARKMLDVLEPLGLTAAALASVARNMAQAREALDWYSFLAARDIVYVNGGDLLVEHRGLRTQPPEIARRLLVQAVRWIGGSEYGPRRGATSAALDAARNRASMTLGGCRLLHQGAHMWICREYNAVRDTTCKPSELWDNRWQLTGPDDAGLTLRPLGPVGLSQCPDWRATGRPHAALIASPAVWRGDELVAAPLAGFENGWKAGLAGDKDEFFASLLSH